MPYPSRKIQKMYGNWEVDREVLVIRWKDPDSSYCWEVDLERLTSSAQVLDYIFQANSHLGAIFSNADIGDLIEALDATLAPQSNYCSCGIEKMTIKDHARLMKSLSKN